MIRVAKNGVYLFKGRQAGEPSVLVEDIPQNQGTLKNFLPADSSNLPQNPQAVFRQGTIAHKILAAHNKAGGDACDTSVSLAGSQLSLHFDAMASHDITFVNIVQTAKVSGLEQFPIPYYLTNCHNSLCAVGGTINEDDHLFGLSAAKKYGGVYVPPHLAVIHSFIREKAAGCGRMILGSDSHTRYGALGTMGVGEGGGELVKQLLRQSYDIAYPKVILVHMTGKPRGGVGPQDVALAIIGAVFKDGFAKNAVLEFAGDGIAALPMDFRAGIDVMTTETTCWSSIWETDDTVKDFLTIHGRAGDYQKLNPDAAAYYDGLIELDLSAIKPMIALPFHPSNVFEIDTLLANPEDIFAQVEKDAADVLENPNVPLKLRDKIEGSGSARRNPFPSRRIRIDQGIIAGCAGGTFDNIMAANAILANGAGRLSGGVAAGVGGSGGAINTPGAFSLAVYPGSQPVMLELAKNGALAELIAAGTVIRTAFCGPCFGAGDVPANNGLSIRHTTRNFPNREGSKPMNGQIASVALMDARSIAATALNGGYLASAESLGFEEKIIPYHYDDGPYRTRVYNGAGKPDRAAELVYGPNITDWPSMPALGENLLLKIVAFITDPVTTTDELIPSGETSSFRSNPQGLAEYTLSRKDPAYVGKAKAVRDAAEALLAGKALDENLPEFAAIFNEIKTISGFKKISPKDIQLGSALFARKPGDGSAREQAASCQRVLGGAANFANEYATKRYRSNLINWGILPFNLAGTPPFKNGDYVFVPGIRLAVADGKDAVEAYVIVNGKAAAFTLKVPELNSTEKEIVLAGSLINFNRSRLHAPSA
ncbi:hydratase [Spirochaetia bacterium]|nr:hydratase [Spirochaetia bacterium]